MQPGESRLPGLSIRAGRADLRTPASLRSDRWEFAVTTTNIRADSIESASAKPGKLQATRNRTESANTDSIAAPLGSRHHLPARSYFLTRWFGPLSGINPR